MIAGCGGQVRMAVLPADGGFVSRPIGLDFGAVTTLGIAAGVDVAMLADLLPRIEAAMLKPPEAADTGDA